MEYYLIFLLFFAPVGRSLLTPGVRGELLVRRNWGYVQRLFSSSPEPGAVNEKNAAATDSTTSQWETVSEPTVYAEDLYGVLGVSSNATTAEIKDSYKSLMFLNHPDRNASTAALYLFRNASYAYQVLGRDPKLRSEYDSKYLSRVYLSVLEDVGTEVLRPLAMDVAVPLINFTAQALGSLFIPVFQSTMESWSLSGPVSGEGEGGSDGGNSLWLRAQRMGKVLEKKNYESKKEQIVSQTIATTEKLQATLISIEELKIVESEQSKIVENLTGLKTVIEKRRNAAFEEEASTRALYESALAEETRIREQMQVGLRYQAETMQNRQSVSVEVQKAAADVERLERELAEAKARVAILSLQEQSMDESMREMLSTSAKLASMEEQAVASRSKAEATYREQETQLATLDKELANVKSDFLKGTGDFNKIGEQREQAERRAAQLSRKETTLKGVLQQLDQERQNVIEQGRQRELETARRNQDAKRRELEKIEKAQALLKAELSAEEQRIAEIQRSARRDED